MTIRTAHSTQKDAAEAAASLKRQLEGISPAFILFFASSRYEPNALGESLKDAFGDVPSLGCTTAGELVSGHMLKNSVVLMAMGVDSVAAAKAAPILTPSDEREVVAALDTVCQGTRGTSPDPGHPLGLVLHDGLALTEESVMSTLTTRSNVPFVGGSAGDDLAFKTTCVFVDFAPRPNSAALAMLRLRRPPAILKTQSFDILDSVLEVTSANEATRTVHTLNGKPASAEYARALGVDVAKLPSLFRHNPLGVLVSETEPFVRSPQKIDGDDVVFFCQIKEGMRLRVLSSRDIVEDTKRDLGRLVSELGQVEGIINFHCILRTLELEECGQCEAYSALFGDVPMIGFSTYGESYIGHINQTSTMVLLT